MKERWILIPGSLLYVCGGNIRLKHLCYHVSLQVAIILKHFFLFDRKIKFYYKNYLRSVAKVMLDIRGVFLFSMQIFMIR